LKAIVEDRDRLTEWLRNMVDDPDTRNQIASRSYWHPNGFAKLVLHTASAFKIRLHIWPAGYARHGETNPHSHRWEFASAVLSGDGLTIVEYEESPVGEPFVRHSYRSGPTDGQTALTPIAAVRLRSVVSHDIAAHGRYVTEVGTLHTVSPVGSSLVATLVVQGPHRADSTVVYCSPEKFANEQGSPLRTFEVRHLVRTTVDTLEPRIGECR
jgi:hypothetical protein